MTKPKMWKTPPRREYKPGEMSPGQVIVWSVRIDAHWTVPPKRTDEGTFTEGIGWVDTVEYERIGTIWSDGPSGSTWWVTPEDEDPSPVVVRRAGKSHRMEWAEGQLFQSGECADWKAGIRRAENVRKRGVYAVVDRTEPGFFTRGRHVPGPVSLCWHTDPRCPLADGKERWDGTSYAREADWTVHRIADVMVGRERLSSPGPFCGHCVMLEPAPETTREMVPA